MALQGEITKVQFLMRMFRPIAIIAAFAAVTTTLVAQQPDPPRIDPAEAIKQLVKRVEPEIPEQVKTARVSGTLKADVIVGTNGRVELVRITQPLPFFSGPAAEAIRQWEFKPFVIDGRATRIITEVSIEVARPAAPERDAEAAYYAAGINCRNLLRAKSPDAVAACQEAVTRADALPAENWERRSEARFLAGQSLMEARQFASAVRLFEESVALWLTHKPADIAVAQQYLMIALAHGSNRDAPKADAAFAQALKAYEERLAAGVPMNDIIARELETLLLNYAAVRRALKDEAGAKAFEARAAKTPGATAAAASPPLARRTIAGVLCFDDGCEGLAEADVTDALTRLPAGSRAWFIDGGQVKAAAPGITVYLERDKELPSLRRGRTVFLIKKTGNVNRWEKAGGADSDWAQIPAPDRATADLTGRDDPHWPFLIRADGRTGTIGDDDLQAVVAAVRTAGADTRAKNLPEPRLQADVQPWPIGSLGLPSNANQVNVYLRSPVRGELPQVVTLTRDGKSWKVTAIGNPAR
jgi:tetratricopeptide (TPR) repeat protein